MPKRLLRWLCVAVGRIAMIVQPSRKRMVLSNLKHAFPNKSDDWYKKICQENFSRLIELGLLSITCGYLPKSRLREDFIISGSNRSVIKKIISGENGGIILLPHVTLMEAMTFLQDLLPEMDLPDIGVIYRPFSNKSLEKFIRQMREEDGMRLLSRKRGFFDAMKILRAGGIVAMLFDQNAGDSGYLMNFFGRMVSSTDLPALLHDKFHAPVYFLYPRRIGFWKASISLQQLNFDANDPKTILFAANKHLEDVLKSSDDACADWLWAHDRWKIAKCDIRKRSRKDRDWMQESLSYNALQEQPKKLSITVRMPNWLGDVVMGIPALRMLRSFRNDIELTLLCPSQFAEFLQSLGIADNIQILPKKGVSYFYNVWKMKNSLPDIYISLVNSLRGSIEAVLIGATRRIGIDTKNRAYRKLFFNQLFRPEHIVDINSVHQSRLWENMLTECGFGGQENLSPFHFCTKCDTSPRPKYSIGIICGSANEPRKRWPSESWKILIERIFEQYCGAHINLYGSHSDATFVDEVGLFFNRTTVSNFVGQTNLLELVEKMQKDDVIIAIDTGGMHIANMFGRPLVCIYGITNPLSTGPIFESEKIIVMPESCPAKGGFATEDVEVDAVFKAVQVFLDRCNNVDR